MGFAGAGGYEVGGSNCGLKAFRVMEFYSGPILISCKKQSRTWIGPFETLPESQAPKNFAQRERGTIRTRPQVNLMFP